MNESGSPSEHQWDRTADTSASMIEAALSGDAEKQHKAYVRFCELYFSTIRRWCLRHFQGDTNAADEAASNLMLNIYEKLQKYSPQTGKTFRSWLSVVTRNECADLRRRANLHRSRVSEFPEELDVPESEDNLLFDLLIDSERRALIRDLLLRAADQISQSDKSVLEGYLAEQSPAEIASLNQKTLPAVYTAMSRIKTKLAGIIGQLIQEHPGLIPEDLMNPN